MKKEMWQEDQPVLTSDLALAQSTKEAAIKERLLDTFVPGVLKDSQLLGETSPFLVAQGPNTGLFITVNTGVAFSPSGERIVIPTVTTYSSSAPTTATDNGIGGTVITPLSTGSQNIAVTDNMTNYVWVGYLETTDVSVYTLSEYNNSRLFVKHDDGFQIKVTTTAINPDPTTYILIAEVAAVSGAITLINTSNTVEVQPTLTATIPNSNTSVIVSASNQTIDFKVYISGVLTQKSATISTGSYSIGSNSSQTGTLCNAVATALQNADNTGTYTVTFSSGKFTISRNVGSIQILSSSTAGTLLGFTVTTQVAADAWNVSTTYYVSPSTPNLAAYGGTIYTCVVQNTGQIPGVVYWAIAGSVVVAPAWNSTTTYNPGDIVSYSSVIYECYTQNTDQVPGVKYWQVVASASITSNALIAVPTTNGLLLPSLPNLTSNLNALASTPVIVSTGSSPVTFTATTGTPSQYQFFVNYATGVVTFNGSDYNTTITVTYSTPHIRRQYCVTVPDIVGGQITSNASVSSYSVGTVATFEDHINARGSGTVSATNPHGLSTADFGITTAEVIGANLVSSGITVASSPSGPGYAGSTVSSLSPSATSSAEILDNFVYVHPLQTGESLNVYGTIILPADISTITAFNFVTSAGIPLASGVYTIYVDPATKAVKMSAAGGGTPSGAFPVAAVTWTGSNILLPIQDLRVFGTTAKQNIRMETLLALAAGAATDNRSTSLYMARLKGTVAATAPLYKFTGLAGLPFSLYVDGTLQTLTFDSSSDGTLALSTVVSDINTAFGSFGVVATATSDNKLEILARISLMIYSPQQTSATILGFTALETDNEVPTKVVKASGGAGVQNNKIDFIIGPNASPVYTATLNATGGDGTGTYPIGFSNADYGSLCAEVAYEMQVADPAGIYTVVFDNIARQFTISRVQGPTTPWSASTPYTVNTLVTLGGITYRCIQAHTNHQPPNVSYWNVDDANFQILWTSGTNGSAHGNICAAALMGFSADIPVTADSASGVTGAAVTQATFTTSNNNIKKILITGGTSTIGSNGVENAASVSFYYDVTPQTNLIKTVSSIGNQTLTTAISYNSDAASSIQSITESVG